MILYDYDSNAILAEPMPSRTAASILAAYKTLHTKLVRSRLKPQLRKLDNESSEALKDFMHTQEVDFQLAPPHVHSRIISLQHSAVSIPCSHSISGTAYFHKPTLH